MRFMDRLRTATRTRGQLPAKELPTGQSEGSFFPLSFLFFSFLRSPLSHPLFGVLSVRFRAPTFTTASASANPPPPPPNPTSPNPAHELDIPDYVPPPSKPQLDPDPIEPTNESSGTDEFSSESSSSEDEEEAAPPPSNKPSFLPKSFGAQKASGSKFNVKRSPAKAPAQPLSREDAAAFQKMEGSFGARMLAKQGWKAGVGLGSDGSGIITPVTTKLRGRGMGIGAAGTERTEQSIREAIRFVSSFFPFLSVFFVC